MAFGEGQIVALLTAGITGCVGAIGFVASRYGTFQSRQTEIEKNLLAQITLNATRIDSAERERQLLEERFRDQTMEFERERRSIETYFRDIVDKQDAEIDALKVLNEGLRHENWTLKNRPIGGIEPVVPPPEVSIIRERLKDTKSDDSGTTHRD